MASIGSLWVYSTGKLVSFMFCSEAVFSWSPKRHLSTWNKPNGSPGGETALLMPHCYRLLSNARVRGLCYTVYTWTTHTPWLEAQRALLTPATKILQRKPVWAVLKVATFLGCNTEFLVNLMKAQCYWHKRFTIDLSSARFRPSLLYPDTKSTTQTSEPAPC